MQLWPTNCCCRNKYLENIESFLSLYENQLKATAHYIMLLSLAKVIGKDSKFFIEIAPPSNLQHALKTALMMYLHRQSGSA